jgi:uncharacterized protein (TIGR02145 family)
MKASIYMLFGLVLLIISGCGKRNDKEIFCSGSCASLTFGVAGESGELLVQQNCNLDYNHLGQVTRKSCTGTLKYEESGKVYSFTLEINYETSKYYVTINGVGSCGDPHTGDRIPIVTTREPESITETTAASGGNVADAGGLDVTSRGVCWSTAENPTILDFKTADGTGTGDFISQMTGLNVYTVYYIRAYATNAMGTGYGENKIFRTVTNLPIILNGGFTDATQTSVIVKGVVVEPGTSPITAKGVCWSNNPGPTLADHFTIEGSGIDAFYTNIDGLEAGSLNYARLYATNSHGTAYSDEWKFWTLYGTVTDIDGNIYPTVRLGEQEWTSRNLMTTRYNDGTQIPNLTANNEWISTTEGACCWYSNDENSYREPYGALYNWYAATNPLGICPKGWSVPTDSQWKILEIYLGMPIEDANSTWSDRGTDQGNQLRMVSSDFWYYAFGYGNLNNTAFNAVGSGQRRTWDGYYILRRQGSYYWSATETETGKPWNRSLSHDEPGISRLSGNDKTDGMSIRCIKN